MGLLARLLGQEPARRSTPLVEATLFVTKPERIAVVGESNYQPALLSITGTKVGEACNHDCFAELKPEPSNPYDSNAVMVCIDGHCVGYLSRTDAAELGPAIDEALSEGQLNVVRAHIAGRGEGSRTPNLGVFLHLEVGRPA